MQTSWIRDKLFWKVIGISFAADFLATICARSVALDDAILASASSGLITWLSAYIILSYTKAGRYIVAAVLGDMLGTFVAMQVL